jgi:hypothetical protein
MTIRRIRISWRQAKATNTHSEYRYNAYAFSLQQWLHEHASLLRLYVQCLSFSMFIA